MEPAEENYILPNGLALNVRDVSRHYFGGYWQVAVEARSSVPVTEDSFASASEFAEARTLLGYSVEFSRRLEKMAVPLDEMPAVRDSLLERVRQNLLPLVSSELFQSRFLAAECRRRSGRKSRGIPCL